MTEEQWGNLVRRLEPQARADPRAYGRKVALLGGLGYAFLGVSLLVLGGLIALVVWAGIAGSVALLKFIIPIGAVALVILRSLVVKVDPPEGIPLKEEQAPELFRMIDEVNERVRGPQIHEVLVNGDLNAGVVQIPRRGGLFGQRNYLMLGLPYMQALSAEEFRAVTAHELGHLSKDHGRFGTWIYRIQMTWWQLLRGLEEKGHWGSGIFRRFFRWYAPYFEAYSYPLRRAHEFEADEAAAKAAGAKPAATSLLAGAVAARYLDADYWPTVYRRADDEREPPTAFAPMREHLARATKHESATTWLEQELTREPEPHDTHPTTAERIRHLGLDPKEVVEAARGNGSPAQTAAQAFLGPAEAALTEDIDRAWRQAIGGAWSERHQEAQRMKARLEELDGRAQQGELSLDDARERAGLTAEFRGAEQALPLYRDVLAREPNDAPAQFAVGQILLEQGEDDGLAHLDRAMEIDADALFPACEAAFLYLKSRGRDEEAERYRARAERRYDTLGLAQEERARPSARGPWDRHVLSAEEVEHLRAALARVPTVKRALLVRKRTQHLDDELPLHALFIFPGGFTWDRQKFLDEVSAELPFDGWMFSPSLFSFKRWQLGRIPGAKIYER